MKVEMALPVGFLDPLPPEERSVWNRSLGEVVRNNELVVASEIVIASSTKQFGKAGDYEGIDGGYAAGHADGMDHVRVHPRFLHSNATSHKWALGDFAELLDNAVDEGCNGASYVSVDVLDNMKEKGKMILVEDYDGGMTPDKMRQCMSLGYSAKSKLANTIGQYGNGFKTSSMRLGADVIVFSRCQERDGISTTQSVGMLSYTFLRSTGKEDIIVPMIDFVKREETWEMLVRSSADDWKRNSNTIVQWSPYESEDDLFQQFEILNDQGTRIIIYNLWEDEKRATELDFDTDPQDIQIKGVNRDEKKIEKAKIYPNFRHFLTYQHSLRAVALVTIGFVKDAEHHIDIQGFNVYHKNRLIKPFWRVWNAAGSDGRGAIGVLEANFVKPAHDKQGFERTIVLARLEARLKIAKKIGYAKRRNIKNSVSLEKEANTPAKHKSCLWSSPNVHTTGHDKSKSRSIGGEYKMGQVHSSIQATNQTMWRELSSSRQTGQVPTNLVVKREDTESNLREENHSTKNRLQQALRDLQYEKDKNKNLEGQLMAAQSLISDLNNNHDNLANMLFEERRRRDKEVENLTSKLKDSSDTNEELHNKVRQLENMIAFISVKREHKH
ncbi:hypothetical protein CQW23_01929 [Capsicum baccatum]|uniref:Morc S5 domain-containing protein n=1 Tax=Capsicum baccatum TaxID=33114 RepID=A0A2G2XPZ2_CAPBA|nr:hypothetical protein CQW23_01929 [Capsicum baccatum]